MKSKGIPFSYWVYQGIINMNLINLYSPGCLTTSMDSSILTLAHLLNVELDTPFNTRDPYLFLVVDQKN